MNMKLKSYISLFLLFSVLSAYAQEPTVKEKKEKKHGKWASEQQCSNSAV